MAVVFPLIRFPCKFCPIAEKCDWQIKKCLGARNQFLETFRLKKVAKRRYEDDEFALQRL